ncbi:unnamed protein product [Gongylonema pulchrum]|uniref:CACTA en-spm transposon protein n=1 Tax=Gongylonema pulchrum TaxID=637853 RepID=A0A183D5S5_9BILA|nr:unnamed protein product [Gongylonema pulchrum]
MSPFVRMSIVPDNAGETSSSEDDDESKSCASLSTCASTARIGRSRPASVMSAKESTTRSVASADLPSSSKDTSGFEEYMKSRFKREMSLEFPKHICYRFITKYNDEPNTSFPENCHFLFPQESASSVQSFAVDGSADIDGAGDQRHIFPLKEVPPGKVLNARVSSKHSAPSCLPQKLSSTGFRIVVPHRDIPVAEVVDKLGVNFDKCAKIVPPKSVAEDDKVALLLLLIALKCFVLALCVQLIAYESGLLLAVSFKTSSIFLKNSH